MQIEYEHSMNQKLLIMKGVFHNMECGTEKMAVTNPAFGELDGCHMLANQFSSAWIFELGIKSMWELSHSKIFGKPEIKKYGHKIHKVYPCLREDFRDFISNKFNSEVTYFHNKLQGESKDLPEADKVFILSRPYFSLEECLKENSQIITDGKYEFQDEKKINVITGIIPKLDPKINEVYCYRQPSPFLKEIMNYIQTQLHAPDYVKNLM